MLSPKSLKYNPLIGRVSMASFLLLVYSNSLMFSKISPFKNNSSEIQIGTFQNWQMSKSDICQTWRMWKITKVTLYKMTKMKDVKIDKCQKWKFNKAIQKWLVWKVPKRKDVELTDIKSDSFVGKSDSSEKVHLPKQTLIKSD